MKAHLRSLLLVEALRAHPHGAQRLLDDTLARERALQADPDPQRALLAWIEGLAIAPAVLRVQRRALRTLLLLASLLAVLAILGGIAAAGAALGSPRINILWALAALIGVPTLMLLLGLLSLPLGGRLPGGPLPPLLRVSLIGRRAPASAEAVQHHAALRGVWRLFGEGTRGRWLFAILSHGLWTLFALAALVTCALRLAFIQFDFEWATTILSEASARQLLQALGAGPALLGLGVPDAALLDVSRAGGTPAGRDVWGRFLLACIAVYALLPRVLLLIVSLPLAARALLRHQPDLGDPVFLPAMLQLRREAQAMPPLGPPPTAQSPLPSPATGVARPIGRYAALVAIELDAVTTWPPAMGDGLDLGPIGSRADLRRVTADLRELPSRPQAVIAVCSLARSPDRAAGDLLAALRSAADAPVLVVLAESDAAQARAIDVATRTADWAETARQAGAVDGRVLELDTLNRWRGEDWRQWLAMAVDA